MSSIGKKDLVDDFAVINGLNRATAEQYIDTLSTLIAEGLAERGKVHLKYLGTFERTELKPKKIYNFHTKKLNEVPAHGRIRFVPSDFLRRDIY